MKGSTRSPAGAWPLALALALVIAACQDGYPIAPTRCDRWCELSRATECGDSSPASCVANCEENPQDAACAETVDALLDCMEAHASSIGCDFWIHGTIPQCPDEFAAQAECSNAHPPKRSQSKE
jgi:hypothetical protein